MAILAIFFLPLSVFIPPAWANNDSRTAKKIACPDISQAKRNVTDAFSLARAYDKGYCGIVEDKKMAEEWYMRAARQDHMLAQYYLGELYFTGSDQIPSDYPQAKRWYMRAAMQGYGPAQLRLGFLYAEAHFKGLKTDYREAEKWFLRAAEQNAGDAQFRLGNFYHNYKVPPDRDKAVLWLTRAAEGGHIVAMFDLSRILRDQQKPEQSFAWMKKSAVLGFLPAQMALSNAYAQGDGVARDPQQAFFWTLQVANSPVAAAFWLNRAADVFFEGGVASPKDYTQALALYKRAAAKDDLHALTRLGMIYLKGFGVPVDELTAKECLHRAAAAGSREAIDILKGQSDGQSPE